MVGNDKFDTTYSQVVRAIDSQWYAYAAGILMEWVQPAPRNALHMCAAESIMIQAVARADFKTAAVAGFTAIKAERFRLQRENSAHLEPGHFGDDE